MSFSFRDSPLEEKDLWRKRVSGEGSRSKLHYKESSQNELPYVAGRKNES
jgi:hypothetical protein